MPRICPKCNNEIPDKDPYCASVKCLQTEMIKIETLPQGGYLAYFRGFKYPFRGNPETPIVGQNATVKRAIMASIRVLIGNPFRVSRNFIWWLSEIYSADFEKSQLPPNMFCPTSKEIIRVGMKFVNGMKDKDFAYTALRFVMCLAMIAEFDSAYRFRLQDILSELDKSKLLKNPRKEVLRLLRLEMEREVGGQAYKTKAIIWVARVFLLGKSKFIRDILIELNQEAIKPDIYDRYFMSRYFDYNFFGEPYEVRAEWKRKEDETFKEIEVDPKDAAQVMYLPNKYFYEVKEGELDTILKNLEIELRKKWKEVKKA